MITGEQIRKAIREMGLRGKCVCIHSSLRSFGQPLEHGAQTLAEAFLSENCTILVPTFSDVFEQPPEGRIPVRNGMPEVFPEAHNRIFMTDSKELSAESMGAFPNYLLEHKDSIRGNHPLNSFTALGPMAKELIESQTPEEVYGPFRELIRHGGMVVLIGTDFTEATIIHYSEQLAGRQLFIRWAKSEGGETIPVRVGSCSSGFGKFRPALEGIARTCKVGESAWNVFPAEEAVFRCTGLIKEDPGITRCLDPKCERCRDAVAGGPVWQEQTQIN